VECHLYGLYLASGQQLVDNHTEVHHKYPNGESNQLYKGVLLDKAKAVFNGKIYVYPDAQKTNAFQQSNNILFSDKATVNAKPQLEIFADDVKCSHGTTVGQLNKEALFYLRSRGISEESAKNLLVNAFAFDVTQKVQNASLRTFLERLIAKKMSEAS
jgi:Fe-S cluster assembly protein SufD